MYRLIFLMYSFFSLGLFGTLTGCGRDSSKPEEIDKIPPAAIKDLAGGRRTSQSVRLAWTAVGDDSTIGTAAQYDLRYSSMPFARWEEMVQATGEPGPRLAGERDTMTVLGLSSSTTYYFRIKAADHALNWSGESNLASRRTFGIGDSIPPASISDLSIGYASYDGILLTWTAVGDDGTQGKASQYDIRWTDRVGEEWDQMGRLNLYRDPSPAGQLDSVRVPWVAPCVRYRFRIAVSDDVGNWSEPSNEVEGLAAPAGPHWCPMGYLGQSYALAEYQGTIVAGGDFEGSVARWDGQRWLTLGGGISGNHGVHSLIVYKDGLVAGGLFNKAGDVDVNNIALWNGSSWEALGAGVDGFVKAMVVYRGDLIVAGFIGEADGVAVNNVARWDGNSWMPLGPGLPAWNLVGPLALAVYDSSLVAGGQFRWEGEPSVAVARWNGSTWSNMGSHSSYGGVSCLQVFGDRLVAGGGDPLKLGDQYVRGIAIWDGQAWSPVGSGIEGNVNALAVLDEHLIAGGFFQTAGGGITMNSIARWDGGSWSPLGTGFEDYGSVSMLAAWGGDLIAGGDFSNVNGVHINDIARWTEEPSFKVLSPP